MTKKIRRLNLNQERSFTLGDKVSEQPVSLIKNTDLITNKKGNARQIHPGRCYDFNGTTDYIEVADHDDFSFGDSSSDVPFSVSGWINADSIPSYYPIISKGSSPSEWSLHVSSPNLIFSCYDGGSSNSIGKYLAFSSTGSWYHICATYDGNSLHTGMKIYIDGIEQTVLNSSTGSYSAMDNTSNSLFIGLWSGFYPNGKMFDIRVHSKELSATDVIDVMNGKASGFEVGWWKMEEAAGHTSYDSSGGGHHGEITNATLSTFHTTDTLPYSFLNNSGYTPSLYHDNTTTAYSYIASGGSEDLNPRTDDYTIDGWFWVEHSGSNTGLLSKGGGAPTNAGYWWYLNSNNSVNLRHTNGTTQWQDTTAILSVGWHYLAMVVDRDDSILAYVDGVAGSSPVSMTDAVDVNPSFTFTIGAYHSGGSYSQYGSISTVRFTRRALTYEEIRDAYFNGFTSDADTEAIFEVDSYGVRRDILRDHYIIDNSGTFPCYIPRNESDISKDVAGTPLAYTGVVKYNTELTSNCCDFDGTDDWISISDSDDFTFVGLPFSVSAWVSPDDLTDFNIIKKDSGSFPTREWIFRISSTDSLSWYVFDSTNSAYIGRYTSALTSAFTEGTDWFHVAGTYDGSGSLDGLKIYINGYRADTTSASSGSYSSIINTTVGVEISKSGSYFADGKMSDVRIFDTELTSAEVLNVMNGDTLGSEVGWWPLAEGQGDVVYDAVGGNHGIVTDATLSTFWSTQNKFHYNLNGFSDALFLDGTAYVTADASSDFYPNTDPFSIEAIVQSNDYADASIDTIYSNAASSADRIWFYINTGGTLVLVADNTSSIINADTDANPFTDGSIHYIAVTIDPGNSVIFYVDGVVVPSTTTTNTGGSIDPAAVVRIGEYYGGASHFIEGSIYGARYSNKARTPDEIWNTYTNGFTVDDYTVALWDFKDGEGNDLTENQHDFTLTNTEHIRIPVTTDLLTDPSGQPVGHLGGRWHNGSESVIDFTGGVTSPMMSNISSGYASFNGSSDYIEVPDNDLFSFTDGSDDDQPFSLSCWVSAADIYSTPFIGKYSSGLNEWLIYTHTDGSLQFILYDESANAYIRQTSSTALLIDAWTHVAGTYDGSNSASGLKIYCNGVLTGSSDTSAGVYVGMENTDAPVWIGRYSTIYAEEFIRDVRIYDEELSADEVKREYKTGSVVGSIVAEYKIYKDARDSSSNKLHGEVISTTEFPKLTVPTAHGFGDLTLAPMYKKVMGDIYLVNGVGGWLNVPSNVAYGMWEWDLYWQASNGTDFHFIGSAQHTSNEAYSLHIGSAASIQLKRDGAVLARTAYGSIGSDDVWFKVKIVRNSTTNEYVTGAVGTFGLYINDELLDVSAGAGTNPVTDNTYTTSIWIEIYYSDVSSNDIIRNFKINGKLVNLSPLIEEYLETLDVKGDREANYTIFERPLIAPAAIRPVHRYTKTESL